MTTLYINSYYSLGNGKYPFSRLLSKISSVIKKGSDTSSLKSKLDYILPAHKREGNVKLGVIMTSAPFSGYDLTLTCFFANSKDYQFVYRCTLGLDGNSITTGHITKISS